MLGNATKTDTATTRSAPYLAILLISAVITLLSLPVGADAQNFIRGDMVADDVVDEIDLCALQCYLYGGGSCAVTGTPCDQVPIDCWLAADVNDDGFAVDMLDLTYIAFYIAMGGAPPPAPFPECGPDPTDPQPGDDCCVFGGYVCGDADGSGEVDIDDVVYSIAYIFSGGPEPVPYESGDSDLSGEVDIDDVVYTITYIFGGGTAPCEPFRDIVINETRYDDVGTDVANFVEIMGPPGTSLYGCSLVGVNGNGGTVYVVIDLTGYSIPPDGFFVVSQSDEAYADLVNPEANFQNSPDNIHLRIGTFLRDAVGYGDFSSAVFAGEGSPAPDAPPGSSLIRDPDGYDTDDNSVDFTISATPSPGAPNSR